jgi:hypothetical protein
MEQTERVVIATPLVELWDDNGPLPATRKQDLDVNDLRELIEQGPVRFVVAEVGLPLRWVSDEDRFAFWKDEVRPHLAHPGQGHWHETFPDSYCYFASKWTDESDVPIVVLERSH